MESERGIDSFAAHSSLHRDAARSGRTFPSRSILAINLPQRLQGLDVPTLLVALEVFGRIRKGLPFAALLAVMEQYGISRDILCTILRLSARNFLRRRGQKRLSPDESDRLYRLARVIAHANRVFEDPEESADWIQSPNAALGRQQPLNLLDTDIGVQQVDQVLGRIEYGIVG